MHWPLFTKMVDINMDVHTLHNILCNDLKQIYEYWYSTKQPRNMLLGIYNYMF